MRSVLFSGQERAQGARSQEESFRSALEDWTLLMRSSALNKHKRERKRLSFSRASKVMRLRVSLSFSFSLLLHLRYDLHRASGPLCAGNSHLFGGEHVDCTGIAFKRVTVRPGGRCTSNKRAARSYWPCAFFVFIDVVFE